MNARNVSLLRLCAVPLLSLSLTGCFSDDISDLTAWVDEVNARPGSGVAALPDIELERRHVYSASGARDPFRPLFAAKKSSGDGVTIPPEPPLSLVHPTEELEAYPLDALRMVGTLGENGDRYGLVRAPDGIVHRVRPGNWMGENYGKITSVRETAIELTEVVLSARNEWSEREAVIGLSE